MKNKKTKKRSRSFVYIRTFFVLLTIIASVSLVRQYSAFKTLQLETKALEEDIAKLMDEQVELNFEIERQNTEANIEKIAREQLGFLKSDEVIIIEDKE